MYFNAKLEIDPSQITLIKKVKPETIFSRFLHFMSLGQLSEKQEHETFTAVAILQQLNMGLRSLKVKNIIRLAVDDYDFYLDEKGVEDDLEQAMFEFKAKVDPLESELFNTIYLVMEHNDDSIKYLIEISIKRKHKVGEYPILIHVNGVLSDFKLVDGEGHPELIDKMGKVFKSQEKYEKYTEKNKVRFNEFVDKLEETIKKFIKIDDLKKKVSMHIIRPMKKIADVREVKHERYAYPVYYGYYNFDSYFFYTWLWADFLFSNNIYVNNFYLVDEVGHEIMSVGRDGFNASDCNTLNTDAEFEPAESGDVEYFRGNEYETILDKYNLLKEPAEIDFEENTSDWLDKTGDHETESFG